MDKLKQYARIAAAYVVLFLVVIMIMNLVHDLEQLPW